MDSWINSPFFAFTYFLLFFGTSFYLMNFWPWNYFWPDLNALTSSTFTTFSIISDRTGTNDLLDFSTPWISIDWLSWGGNREFLPPSNDKSFFRETWSGLRNSDLNGCPLETRFWPNRMLERLSYSGAIFSWFSMFFIVSSWFDREALRSSKWFDPLGLDSRSFDWPQKRLPGWMRLFT